MGEEGFEVKEVGEDQGVEREEVEWEEWEEGFEVKEVDWEVEEKGVKEGVVEGEEAAAVVVVAKCLRLFVVSYLQLWGHCTHLTIQLAAATLPLSEPSQQLSNHKTIFN